MMTLSTPPPQSGTFDGGKGAKMIHQPSYLHNGGLFLFERGEAGAGRPLALPERPHDELRGGHSNQQMIHKELFHPVLLIPITPHTSQRKVTWLQRSLFDLQQSVSLVCPFYIKKLCHSEVYEDPVKL